MRAVLLAFALTSNGSTASWDPAGSGDGDDIPSLGYGDAPQLYWAHLWNEAETDERRANVVRDAEKALDKLHHSCADHAVYETKADRDKRIVKHGEGIDAREVANWARCGITDVWQARAAAGRETEYGRIVELPTSNGAGRPRTIDTHAVLRLAGGGLNAHQIADELDISYSSTLRALGRKA